MLLMTKCECESNEKCSRAAAAMNEITRKTAAADHRAAAAHPSHTPSARARVQQADDDDDDGGHRRRVQGGVRCESNWKLAQFAQSPGPLPFLCVPLCGLGLGAP